MPAVETIQLSILDRIGGEIFLDHKSNLEDDSILKFSQIQTCKLLDLFKTIDKSISVNEEFS